MELHDTISHVMVVKPDLPIRSICGRMMLLPRGMQDLRRVWQLLCKRRIDPLQDLRTGKFISEGDLHLALSRIDSDPFDLRILRKDALDGFGVRFVLHSGVRGVSAQKISGAPEQTSTRDLCFPTRILPNPENLSAPESREYLLLRNNQRELLALGMSGDPGELS